MKEITFSPEAIAAIRAGAKTKTRRRMKNPPRWWQGHRIGCKVYPNRTADGSGFGRYTEVICAVDGGHQRRNPYGDPGARLRIRGTRLTIEIQQIELATSDGAEGHDIIDSRFAARTWIVEFARVRVPWSTAKGRPS